MPFAVHALTASGLLDRLVGIYPGEDREAAGRDIERHRRDVGLSEGQDFTLVRVGPEHAERLRAELSGRELAPA
jgi:hypothetical protein